VQPEFKSEYPFLRARACWLYGQIASEDMDFFLMSPGLLVTTLDGVLHCLNDSEFPVRVQAGVDVRHFLSSPAAREVILPMLPQVLEQVCKLIDEVDNTDIVATIETIVERFSDHVVPFAGTLTSKLVVAFLRASSAGEDEEESTLAAVQCVQAIQAIVQSAAEKQSAALNRAAVVRELEPHLLPLFTNMFEEDRMDFFEDLLELLSLLVYYSAVNGQVPLSEHLWSMFPRLLAAFDQWAFDFSSNLVSPIDNFISNDTEQFLVRSHQGVPYPQLVFSMIVKLWSELDVDDDAEEGTKIAEVLVLNCTGRIDTIVESLVERIVVRLNSAVGTKLKVLLLSNIAACLYYNAGLTLEVLDKRLNVCQQLFGLWLSMIDSFVRIHDKKLTLLALSSVLRQPLEQLPESIKNGIPQLVHYCIALVEKLRSERAQRGASAEPIFRPASGLKFAGSSERDFNDEEDADVNTIDDGYLERIAKEAGVDLGQLAAAVNVEDGDGDDDEDFLNMDDEGDFESPIDDVDEAHFFANSVRSLPDSAAQSLLALMQPSDSTTLRQLLESAPQQEHQN